MTGKLSRNSDGTNLKEMKGGIWTILRIKESSLRLENRLLRFGVTFRDKW